MCINKMETPIYNNNKKMQYLPKVYHHNRKNPKKSKYCIIKVFKLETHE